MKVIRVIRVIRVIGVIRIIGVIWVTTFIRVIRVIGVIRVCTFIRVFWSYWLVNMLSQVISLLFMELLRLLDLRGCLSYRGDQGDKG
jgi:hypothetical protein